MQAVRFMEVSLSNMPCVSISSTATSSPPATRRMKGSLHIQMPVVVRSFPARHWKLDSVALDSCCNAMRLPVRPGTGGAPTRLPCTTNRQPANATATADANAPGASR